MRLGECKKKGIISKFFFRGVVIVTISIVTAILVIRYFSNKAEIIMLPMAEEKLKKVVSMIIGDATKDITFDKDLISLEKNQLGEIKMIRYNTYEVTKLISLITGKIENEINIYSNSWEYTMYEIPIGVIFNSSFLNKLGPNIKIKSDFIGSIVSNIETEVKPYGINNAYIETRIYLDVTARIYLPFVSKDIEISNVIPISMNIVQGSVPEGYITSYK